MLEPEPEPVPIGPEPPPMQVQQQQQQQQQLTLADISALRSRTGPFEDLDQRQLCVCCACEKEMERAQAHRCSRCRLAFYCSRDCQKQYHKRHVRWCKAEAAAQARLREEYPTALVCSKTLIWHVRRWDARSKETCPDPRYYLQKTRAKHPAYSALVEREPERLSGLWSYPRCSETQLDCYCTAKRMACLGVLDGEADVCAATTAKLCAAAVCLVAPDGTTVASSGASLLSVEVLYNELLARASAVEATGAVDDAAPAATSCTAPQPADGRSCSRLPPLPLPGNRGLDALASALLLARAAKRTDDEVTALAARFCGALSDASSGTQQVDAISSEDSPTNGSAAITVDCGEALASRQLLIAAQAEFRLGSHSSTAQESEPHHRRAVLYARASVRRYVDFIGPETLASDMLNIGAGADAVASPSPWLVEGWWTALFEWGRNAFLCGDFDEASRVLLAAWSFVQDQAHSGFVGPDTTAGSPPPRPSVCQHCAIVADWDATDSVAGGLDSNGVKSPEETSREDVCWLCGYLRNICTQAHLAKEDEEGQFVLEGFQRPTTQY